MNALQEFANGDLNYIAKLNSNYAVVAAAINALEQMMAGQGGAAASLPTVLESLFGANASVIGAGSYGCTNTGLTIHVAAGYAWLPTTGVVVHNAAPYDLDLTGAADGTYYVSADATGVPRYSTSATDALYSVVKTGAALGAFTRVAAISWAQSDWVAAQASSGLGAFTSLDARLEAIEAAGAPDLGDYQQTDEKGAANGYAGLDAGSRVPSAQLPLQPVMVTTFGPGVPGNAALLHSFLPSVTVTFPQNLAGSRALATAVATAATVLTVKKNGVAVGTITFGAGANTATFAAAAQFTVGAGDELTVHNQAVSDATLSDIRLTLVGTRAA